MAQPHANGRWTQATASAPGDTGPWAVKADQSGDRLTIQQALAWASDLLRRESCPEPRLDAELLLAHALGWDRARLLAYPERPLAQAEGAAFNQAVARRAAREPLAYILGHWAFRDLDLQVNRHVLIPRPETEFLVEQALAHLGRREAAPGGGPGPLLADVGTGSGAIAIALARAVPAARVYALDRSADALAVAAANCRRYRVAGRVALIQGDLLSALGAPVDGIVANLPYVEEKVVPHLAPEVSRHEPRLALDGGAGGTVVIRRLLAQTPAHLARGGFMLLEIGANQGPEVLALAQATWPAARVSLHQDYAGLDRVVAVAG